MLDTYDAAEELERFQPRSEYPFNFIDTFFLGSKCRVELPLPRLTSAEEYERAIDVLLSSYSELDRQVIMMHFRDGMTDKEIKEALDISYDKIRSRISKPLRSRGDEDLRLLLTYGQKGVDYVHCLSKRDAMKIGYSRYPSRDRDSKYMQLQDKPELAKSVKFMRNFPLRYLSIPASYITPLHDHDIVTMEDLVKIENSDILKEKYSSDFFNLRLVVNAADHLGFDVEHLKDPEMMEWKENGFSTDEITKLYSELPADLRKHFSTLLTYALASCD